MDTVDLLIIGAGPAGLSTALHLTQRDPTWTGRMLLLEKATHPRHKLCGGGVTRLGLDTLINLGFSLPLPIPQARVDDVRLIYGTRAIHVHGRPKFLIFHRAEFDAYLADQARHRGIFIKENEVVEAIQEDAQGLTVKTEKGLYRARTVVGADGSKGVVRRLFKKPDSPSRVARLLEVLTPASENAPHFTDHYALFDFTPARHELQGYFWDFPSWVAGQPKYNRGVYDARFAIDRPRADLPHVLDIALESLGSELVSKQVEGHPIHWFSPRNQFSRPRILLAGDAAGADPLFGEGIAPALGYGQVAAEAIQKAYENQDFSFHDYRRLVLRSPVGRYLLLRWFVAWWCYQLSAKPWFMQALWSFGKIFALLWPEPRGLDGAFDADDNKSPSVNLTPEMGLQGKLDRLE